ncbi:MAG: sugar-binding protein [Chloroflexi bacterium]|nr:sugar-binding protein [Chloroflexota bacterium]
MFSVSPSLSAQDKTPTPYPVLTDCPLEDGVFNIAWIPKALNNPVFELGRIGAEIRATELTEIGPCEVEVFYAAPMNATAEEQAELLLEAADLEGLDAIGVSCIDPEICVDPINVAVEKGLAVMTWDSDSADSDRLTYLGVDNFEGGAAAADLLVRAMGESGQVALLSGVEGSANLEARIEGFKSTLEQYPDIEIVTTVYCNDLAPLAVEVVETTMEEYPEMDGWFFVGLWPLFAGKGAMPLWEEAALDNGMVTVAFDTLPLELELIQDGFIQGLVGQKYWGWGYDTVQMLYEHVLYGREFESFSNSGMDIVTPLNVEAMLEAWETNDFTKPLPDPFEAE